MSTTEIEKRLIAVEQAIAHLKTERQGTPKRHPIHTLESIHGTFENDDAFKEASRLGREWRKSQRAVPNKSKAKRK
jgi:hypothetical protein